MPKKKVKRKRCYNCGSSRVKKNMRYDPSKKKWLCIDCSEHKSSTEAMREHKPSLPPPIDFTPLREHEVAKKPCPSCDGTMVDKGGFWKCVNCGGFTRLSNG